jgi:hypothetical protein
MKWCQGSEGEEDKEEERDDEEEDAEEEEDDGAEWDVSQDDAVDLSLR